MSYLGDRALGATIRFMFTTSVNDVPTDMAGSPTMGVYRNGTLIAAAPTISQTYNSVVGLNFVSQALSSGVGFNAAGDYSFVITAGTLGGVSMVGYEVASFSVSQAQANVYGMGGSAAVVSTLTTLLSNVISGACTTGGTATSIVTSSLTNGDGTTAGTSASDYVGRTVMFNTNTPTAALQGCVSAITAFGSGTTFTVSPALNASPASGDSFVII